MGERPACLDRSVPDPSVAVRSKLARYPKYRPRSAQWSLSPKSQANVFGHVRVSPANMLLHPGVQPVGQAQEQKR
jgi:hypothetical protein